MESTIPSVFLPPNGDKSILEIPDFLCVKKKHLCARMISASRIIGSKNGYKHAQVLSPALQLKNGIPCMNICDSWFSHPMFGFIKMFLTVQ